jgi:hypothetical protein
LPYLELDVVEWESADYTIADSLPDESRLPVELRAFCGIIVLLTVTCTISECIGHFVMHRPHPYNWPFMPFFDNVDMRCYIARFHAFHRIEFFSFDPKFGPIFGYPAPGAVLYKLFYLSPRPIRFFFVVSLSLMTILAAALFRAIRAEGVSLRATALFMSCAVVLSYPLWFEFLLANLEVFVFLAIAAGILAFLRGHTYTAAALIAIAGSIKLVPLIYLGLLIARRQYRQVLFAAALVGGITLASLWLVCPNIALSWRGVNMGLNLFRNSYMLHFRSDEIGFDHSIFAAIKQFTLTFETPSTISVVLSRYTCLAAMTGILLFFTRIQKLPVLNQILCLTVAELVLPPLSHDYTLLNLYLSWGLLIVLCLREARKGRRIPGMMAVFFCFAILMSPETEIIAAGQSYGGQMKCAVLLALVVLALRFPFASEFDAVPAAAQQEMAYATQ